MAPFIRKSRFCRCFDGADYFKPRGIPLGDLQVNDLALDELEAMHLCDFEALEQKTAAEKMKVSTSTLQRLLYSGRKKAIDALYGSKALKISKHNNIREYTPLINADQKRKRSECSKDSTVISD